MGTCWEPTQLEQASPGGAAPYGSPWIIIPVLGKSWLPPCWMMGSVPAELGVSGNPCDRAQLPACTPSAGWRWGRWGRSSEIGRMCKTATQRQDLNGVVIQAVFAWAYSVLKCLKIFSLEILTNKWPLLLLVHRIFLAVLERLLQQQLWLWPVLLVTWMDKMRVSLYHWNHPYIQMLLMLGAVLTCMAPDSLIEIYCNEVDTFWFSGTLQS